MTTENSRADALTEITERLQALTALKKRTDSMPVMNEWQWLNNLRNRLLAASPVEQPAAAPIEETIRFCPECGRLGDIPAGFEACCPDWSQARVVPKRFAELCAETFKLCVNQPFPQPAPSPADERAEGAKAQPSFDERKEFEAWLEETSGFSSDDESIAWSSWQARASLFNAANAEGVIYQILTEEGAWLDTTREYYERVKSDPALARIVYAAPQPAQADARVGLTDHQELIAMIDNNVESLGNVAIAADEKELAGLSRLLRKVGDTLSRSRAALLQGANQ